MSAVNATSSKQNPAGSTTDTSRRSQVMVGNLPDDFLRSSQSQVQEDERIARVLQAQQQAGITTHSTTSNVAGRLSITIVQAKLNKSYGLTKMDPYCRVRVGHAVFETPTVVSGGKNPCWHKNLQIYLPHGVDSVYLEIFDERSFTVDDRVAWTVIKIPPSVMSGETVDEWFNLSGRLGDGLEGSVNVVLSMLPPSSVSHMSIVNAYTTPMMMPFYFPPVPQPFVQPVGMYPPPTQQQYRYPAPQPPAHQQPQPQPQPPQLSEEDLKQIKDMFPAMEDDVIKSVFEANHGRKDATINCLLSMT